MLQASHKISITNRSYTQGDGSVECFFFNFEN